MSVDTLNADLATLRDALVWAGRRDYDEALDRLEAELSRLREQRDDERREREYTLGLAARARDRYQAAEARCARLQQALDHVKERALHDQEPDYELIDRALAGPDTPADSQEDTA